MKNHKLISFLLCLSLLVSMSVPVLASDGSVGLTYSTELSENNTDMISEGKVTRFEKVGTGKYYTEITSEYTLCVGVVNNVVDCSINYHNEPNKVYSACFETTDAIKALRNIDDQLLTYSKKLLSGEIQTQPITFASINSNRGDVETIMNRLYEKGWPESYTFNLRETRTQNGATGKLYQSVSYSINKNMSWLLDAGKTLASIAGLTGAAVTTLQKVLSFVINIDGVLALADTKNFSKYNVFANGDKAVYVQDTNQYNVGRTVKWYAYVGDGCLLELQYDTKHTDYDNHDALFTRGFYNYFN